MTSPDIGDWRKFTKFEGLPNIGDYHRRLPQRLPQPSLTPLRRQCITPHLASARARKETMKAKKTPAKKVVKPKAAAKPVAKKSAEAKRSEERHEGKESDNTCRKRW